MGRPKKSPDLARDARINIRVRKEYADWLKRLAEHAGADDVTDLVVVLAAEKAKRMKFEPPPER